MPRTLSHRAYVAIMSQDPDEWCVLLAELGFSAKLIASETGLSPSQVYNRLRKRRVKITDYRNGLTQLSKYVINNTAKLPARSPVALNLSRQLYLPKLETKGTK